VGTASSLDRQAKENLEYLLESRDSRKVRYVLALSDGTHLLVL